MKKIGDSDKYSGSIILPGSLKNKESYFRKIVSAAKKNIHNFALKYGWQELTKEKFIEKVIIFDDKAVFDKNLLKISGTDRTIELPETYCAALENKILISMIPEYYARVYPQGVEENYYEKLFSHEIAHRLHIRILDGDEDAMGPVWFYEGFAIYAADQFTESDILLSKTEMENIIEDSKRGSYINYNFIFRFFVDKIPLIKLINRAKSTNFSEEMIAVLKKIK